jgi:hypothetical protein
MRWKFPDPDDAAEASQRQVILGQIDRWWADFATRTKDLDAFFHRRKRWDVPGWVNSHLKSIRPDLAWEFGPGAPTGHYLAITPEGNRRLCPLVEVILSRAPQLDGWTFFGGRPPGTLEWALQAVGAKGGGDLSQTRVRASLGELHRIDLRFQAPHYLPEDDDQPGRRDAFLFIEALLGEEVLDTWVGVVAAEPLNPELELLPLDRLQETANSLIRSVMDQLPDRPCQDWCATASYTMWHLQPQTRDDYPGQADLWIASSRHPDVWNATHDGRSFASVRYSRHGELFGYLKLDGTEPGAEALSRDEINDAINTALVEANLGCTIGGGTGLRYSYVDFCLTDPPAALALVRRVLRALNVGKRSWLLFFDRDLSEEWLGVWPETPTPPQ